MKSFRFLLNQKIRNFPAFVRRTVWFWCALLLLFLLPGVREQFLMLINGPPMSFGARAYSYGHSYNTFRPSSWENDDYAPKSATPFDVEMLRFAERGGDYNYYYEDSYSTTKTVTRANIAALLKRFPREKWLYAAPLSAQIKANSALQTTILTNKMRNARTSVASWRKVAQDGARLEPNNAFYPTAIALFEWHLGHKDAALKSLERAARCSAFDDHNLEWARATLAAHAHIATLSWEERRDVWGRSRTAASPLLSDWSRRIAHRNARLRQLGRSREALRWSGALARVGDLLQRGHCSPDQWRQGENWKKRAWSVAMFSKKNWLNRANAPAFAKFARSNGRADLGREAIFHDARNLQLQKALQGFQSVSEYRAASSLVSKTEDFWLLASSIGAWIVMFHFAFLFCAWFVVNFFLWRGIGEPSSRRDRFFPAAISVFAVCAGALAMGYVIWLWSNVPRTGARIWQREGVIVAICMLLFFSMPFWSAVFCAFATARRERKLLSIAPRQALELRFSRFSMLILERGALFVALSSLFLTLALSLVWALANWFGWRPLNFIEDFAPEFSQRFGIDKIFFDLSEGVPAFYGWWVVAFVVVAWFVRWRWLAPMEKRPVTHGGLRRWKETLGVAFVLECWVFLMILVALWPLRSTLHGRLDRVVQRGELVLVDAR